jgi:type 1 glutamine amidotransferase
MGESFVTGDELFHDLKMSSDVHVLAAAYSDPENKGTGETEPVLWTIDYGQGRVFHTTLGHDLEAMHEAGFITTFVRGCEWAGAGSVSTPARIEPHARVPGAIRVLLVTGGHSFDTDFYTVFNDFDEIVWDHRTSNEEAYKSDFREKYDVLVLYDMSKQIGDEQKKNLRAFVESDKGIIVLHHAIADYNDWSWWTDEVVGGMYLLKPMKDMPASTFSHDEELNVQAVSEHPITSGLSHLHIMDETYKGMWISPEVNVLLRTDHPKSDGPVAWISPYEKSRVVTIQLGHDRHANLHPGFQRLVRRAIQWSAGRLE